MSAATMPAGQAGEAGEAGQAGQAGGARPAASWVHALVLAQALVARVLRNPAAFAPNVVIASFLLVTYDGLLGGSPAVAAVTGGDFLAFVLPVSVLTAAVSGSLAGQLLVEDVESGYLRRLLAMPVSRSAVVLAPMLVGALAVLVQTVVVVGFGVVLGVRAEAGVIGLVGVVALAFAFGLAFAGFSVATALLTRSAAAVQSASLVFFPLLFMAPALLPRNELQGWLQTVSTVNPVTYLVEAMRVPLLGGDRADLLLGGVVAAALALAMLGWATLVAGRAGSRR